MIVLVAVTGARRMPWRHALPVVAAGVVTVCTVNAVGFYLLASWYLAIVPMILNCLWQYWRTLL
ncbi:hypothetical protein [Kitasatospora sp. NPDC059571]|uniref:hypothetical protein n=1 Tax=Kitasatospora sp. NPDC059571 TaxID=3346871 RepID=UPI0036C5D4D3